MAKNFLTPINLNKNELQNGACRTWPRHLGSPVKGQLYMNTSDNTLYWWDGAQWIAAKAAAGATPAGTVTTGAIGDAGVVGVSTNFAREDHKHGMPAFGAAVSDTAFASAKVDGTAVTVAHSDHTHGNPTHDNAAHSAVTLNSLAAPTADRTMGGFKLTGLGTPAAGTDAVTKDYADNLSAGLSWKEAVRIATTANVTQSGLAAIDGVTPIANDRILCKDQSTGSQNGIWLAQSGAWTRALDADAAGELEGATVFVMEGTANADKAFTCTTNAPITVGTTATVWVQFGAGTSYTAGAGLLMTGSTIDVQATDATIVVSADSIARAALTGDVTTSINAATIATGVVSNAKLATMAANTVKMNNTGGVASPTDVTVANLKTALAMPNKYTLATVGGATSQVITHNLNTQAVLVDVYRTLTPWDSVECDIERTTVNTCTLRFAVAPATNEYSVVVIG